MPHIGYFPVPGFPRPLSINPSAFVCEYDNYDWFLAATTLSNRAALTAQKFYAPVDLPQGARVTKVTLYGWKGPVASIMRINLFRVGRADSSDQMAITVANWTGAWSSVYTDTISYPVIDNVNYSYCVELHLDPDVAPADVKCSGVVIDWQ